ncbi:uncharacterized protein LOC111247307 [Varroa destructor]|uniref:Uncharacterized protein n=2 Tax=Varroa TaxID=62624 RepID=A0A7M7JKX8_VARDE|nr:uncharacterized protein LOC111247307 [Varroa destructor]
MGLNFLVVSSPYQQTVSVWQWVDHLEFTRLTEIRISARLVHPFWPDMKDRVMLAIVESHSLFVRIFDGDWDELHRQGLENLKNYHSLPTTFPYHRSQINTARSHEMGHMYTKNKTEQDSTYLENSPTVTIGFEKSPITNHSLNVSVRENTFPEHKTHPQKAARSDLAVQLNLGKTPLSSKQTKNNKVVQTSTAKSHVPFMSTNHIQRRNPKILSPRYQSRATKTRITTRLASNEEKDEQARETWGESAEASPEDDDEFVLTDFPPAPAETGSEAVSTMKEALDVHQRTPVKIDWWFNRDEVAIGNYLMEHDKNIIRVPLDEDKFRRKEKTKQLSNEEKPITNYVDVDEKLYKVRRERYISTQV